MERIVALVILKIRFLTKEVNFNKSRLHPTKLRFDRLLHFTNGYT